MIVIPPINCNAPGVLTATSAVNLPAWVADTTYAADAQISHANRNWVSVQATNLGKTPGAEPLWWVDDGPINSLAMFDTSVQTATTALGGLSWTMAVGRFNGVGLMGLKGQSITLTVQDGGTVLHSETRTLASSEGTYYSFVFETPFQIDSETFLDVNTSALCTVTISIATTPLATAACGLCVIGKQFFVGHAQYGFSNPIEDRGRHYLDSLGNPVNVERGYSKNINGSLVADRASYNQLMSFFAAHVGEPMLWVALPNQRDMMAANVFGRYVRSVVAVESFSEVTVNLDIAGYR